MPHSLVCKELRIKAEEELSEVPSKIQKSLEHIRRWLKEQPHLHARTDDQSLVNFLRISKYDIDKAKGRIELFYTNRTKTPEFFTNRDPLSPEIQDLLNRRIITILPKTVGPSGSRLIFIRARNADPKRTSATTFAKCVFMILDILCKEDPNSTIAGISLITDLENMHCGYITQMTPSFLKKMATSLIKAYPIRVKAVYFINAPSFFAVAYHVMKLILSEKLKQRIHFYSKLDDCYNVIPRLVLPKEYGGEQASCDEISDQLKLKLESYRYWLLDDEQFLSNETERPKKSRSPKKINY